MTIGRDEGFNDNIDVVLEIDDLEIFRLVD